MGCVESRREISALPSLSFSLCASILWLLQLDWCRLRWTGQIDWSSPVVVAMAPVGLGKQARGVQMCRTTMCKHIWCVRMCLYTSLCVCVSSFQMKWGFMLFKLAHTSRYQPIIKEGYLNHTSPATFLCSLFEWTGHWIEKCRSQMVRGKTGGLRICFNLFFLFSLPQRYSIWGFGLRKNTGEKKSFNLSFSSLIATAQKWTKPTLDQTLRLG